MEVTAATVLLLLVCHTLFILLGRHGQKQTNVRKAGAFSRATVTFRITGSC